VEAGLATSNGEARRAVANGAVSVNDMRVTDAQQMLHASDLTAEGVIKLSMGKKKHVLLRV
jgi:tyrosyl-tRNA synthetase